MANQLRAVVTADIRAFTTAMDKVGLSAGGAAGAAIGAFAAIAASLGALAVASINAATRFEDMRTRLQLLAGDMNKGSAEFDELAQKAKNSAFETDKLIEAYIRLRASSGLEFAKKNIDNIGYAAIASGQDMASLSARIGELVIKMRSGRSGAELAETLSTLSTAFGEESTLNLVKMAREGRDNIEILKAMEEALARVGKMGKFAVENSPGGKKARLGGVVTDMLAGLGGGETMETYKLILDEMADTLLDIQQTDAFRALADSAKELAANILDLIKSDGFKTFLLDVLDVVRLIADAFSVVIKAIKLMADVYNMVPDLFRKGAAANASNAIAGVGNTEEQLKQMSGARESRDKETIKVRAVYADGEDVYQK